MLFLEAPWDVNQNNGRILFLQLVGVEMGKVNNLTEGSETVYKNVVNDRKSNNLLVKGRGGGGEGEGNRLKMNRSVHFTYNLDCFLLTLFEQNTKIWNMTPYFSK